MKSLPGFILPSVSIEVSVPKLVGFEKKASSE
jgi:hypothetical protein